MWIPYSDKIYCANWLLINTSCIVIFLLEKQEILSNTGTLSYNRVHKTSDLLYSYASGYKFQLALS